MMAISTNFHKNVFLIIIYNCDQYQTHCQNKKSNFFSRLKVTEMAAKKVEELLHSNSSTYF